MQAIFTTFKFQEQVVRHRERVVATANLKKTQKELDEARKCAVEFELMMTKKKLEFNQKENAL